MDASKPPSIKPTQVGPAVLAQRVVKLVGYPAARKRSRRGRFQVDSAVSWQASIDLGTWSLGLGCCMGCMGWRGLACLGILVLRVVLLPCKVVSRSSPSTSTFNLNSNSPASILPLLSSLVSHSASNLFPLPLHPRSLSRSHSATLFVVWLCRLFPSSLLSLFIFHFSFLIFFIFSSLCLCFSRFPRPQPL